MYMYATILHHVHVDTYLVNERACAVTSARTSCTRAKSMCTKQLFQTIRVHRGCNKAATQLWHRLDAMTTTTTSTAAWFHHCSCSCLSVGRGDCALRFTALKQHHVLPVYHASRGSGGDGAWQLDELCTIRGLRQNVRRRRHSCCCCCLGSQRRVNALADVI